jgi:hypothetical protein
MYPELLARRSRREERSNRPGRFLGPGSSLESTEKEVLPVQGSRSCSASRAVCDRGQNRDGVARSERLRLAGTLPKKVSKGARQHSPGEGKEREGGDGADDPGPDEEEAPEEDTDSEQCGQEVPVQAGDEPLRLEFDPFGSPYPRKRRHEVARL